jgi:DNA (cytosine-5)-methyltransferase 1
MLKVATVFSGIGAIEHALQRMNISYEIIFACDNGDVNILSKVVDNDILEMEKEADTLSEIINKIEHVDCTDASYKNDLILDLSEIVQQLKAFKSSLCELDGKKLELLCFNILTRILEMPNLSTIRRKEYTSFLADIRKNNTKSSGNLKFLKYLLEIINDFIKDNKVIMLESDCQTNYVSRDNIDWLAIFDNISEAYKYSENVKAKKIIKISKAICDSLSMLHERINTFDILQKLNTMSSYKDKKDYVDSLYRPHENKNKVRQSYLANYSIDPNNYHWNVSFIDGKQYTGNVDLFVGGSPCQSFSLVGKQRGLDDTRGTLFYEYARLVKEIRPKIFIYENVKAILSNDNGKTWSTMEQVFNSIDYRWKNATLNAKDYGVPQNRERVFVVGFNKDLVLQKSFAFPGPVKLEKTMQDCLLDNVSGKYYLPRKGVNFVTDTKNLKKKYTQIDGEVQLCQKKNQQFNWHGDFVFVEENNNIEATIKDLEKYFLSEKVEKYVLATGTKGFYSRPKTDLEVARPLLTTMHKMHRAGVDNYVTTEGRLRKLTPRECLRLMGFCDTFNIVVSDTAMYQQAGNSIVVDVLMAIMKKILESYPKLVWEVIEDEQHSFNRC